MLLKLIVYGRFNPGLTKTIKYLKIKSTISACTDDVYTCQLNRYSIYSRARFRCTFLAVKVGHFVLQITCMMIQNLGRKFESI